MSGLPRAAVGALAIALAAAGGFLAYQLLRPELPATAPALPAAGPTASEAIAAQRAIPEVLPKITLADREGVPRALSEWAGRPLLVNFWATWCAPCRREIPLLLALRQERAAQRLEVIGIAVDFRDAVLEYAAEIGIDYPLLIGEQDGLEAVSAFGMDMLFPFTVFADRRSRIVALKVGELHRDEAEFILDRIAAIDAGELELPAAREQIAARLKELAAERARRTTADAPASR